MANMAIYFSAQWIEVFDVMGMKEVLGGISNDITRINASNASKKYSCLNHNKYSVSTNCRPTCKPRDGAQRGI